ncbi:MAG: Stp1/IreP family PP2C-type Ser/Thr phosphatase [Actinobacteria bacterium]|nr:Stp1/IreP family PP2C-type Ser/Thr phosphatase [Actinomycetota bacterium]
MRSAGVTDTGRRRRRNEDAYVCEPPLFAIADGMGGAQAGEVASGLAAAVLEETRLDAAADDGEARIEELIREANRRVFQRSNEDAATSGMGTTMTVALVNDADGTIAFGHVGDSRAYRVRDGRLDQLTDDHSLVGELMRSGKLSAEEAEAHPQRSVITRALGTEPDIDVDTFTVEAEPDDVFLLCSDGLTDMVSDRDILAVLQATPNRQSDDLQAAARALVEAANAGGGEDNITVVVFRIDDADEAGATSEPAAGGAPLGDDEDTLSGLEKVPAVDTAVIPAEEVVRQAEEDEREGKRDGESRRRLLPLLLLVLLLALVALLVVWGLYR